MLTDRIEKIENSNHVGPTPDQWGKVAGKFTLTTEYTSVSHDGVVSYQKHSVSKDFSLDLLESGQAGSHTHNLGGDADMEKCIVKGFFEDENIEKIYAQSEGQEVNLLLIYKDEVDELALRLAKIQNNISKKYPGHTIEILYIPSEVFTEDFIPDGSVPYYRG